MASNKSYTVLESKDRAPERRAHLITTDTDFGVVEIVSESDRQLVVAFREVVRGKGRWRNAAVTLRSVKSLRPISAQGGERVRPLSVPTWLSSPVCHVVTA